MTATAEAARKSATSSKQSSSLNPIPQRPSDWTHNAHSSGRILIRKNAASRIIQRNDAVGKTEAPISQPKAKKIATEKKDGLYNASSQRKSALPGLDTVATAATTTKQSVPSECLTLQRMGNKAIRSLEERRWIAQTALEGLFPLMRSNDAIEIAVAALEKQIYDCNSDIQQLKRLVHSSQTDDVKATDFKVRPSLPIWNQVF